MIIIILINFYNLNKFLEHIFFFYFNNNLYKIISYGLAV